MAQPGVVSDSLIAGIVAAYTDAEERLIALMAAKTKQGLDAPEWAEKRLTVVQEYRKQAERIAQTAAGKAADAAAASIQVAYNTGHVQAVAELSEMLRIADTSDLGGQVDLQAMGRLQAEARTLAIAPAAGMVEQTTAVLNTITMEAVAPAMLGADTRRSMAQQALDRMADRGITGFTDRAGRRWALDGYVEMAMRTQMTNATIAGHTARLQQFGHDLVVVSAHQHGCDLCAPFEGKVLSLSGAVVGSVTRPSLLDDEPVTVNVYATVDDARQRGLFHPNCVVADTDVLAAGGIRATDSSWYEGDMIVIKTALGNELTITPNHPVLTDKGWVAAGELAVGANLVRDPRQVEREEPVGPHEQLEPTLIGDIHRAFVESSAVPPVSVPTTAHDFHGDGGHGNVEIVFADSLLLDRIKVCEETGKRSLIVGSVGEVALANLGPVAEFPLSSGNTANSIVGGGNVGEPLLGGHSGEVSSLRFASADRLITLAAQPVAEPALGHSYGCSSFLLGEFAGKVSLDSVVEVSRIRSWAGHVYNLESEGGWYGANSIVVHNCAHTYAAWQPGMTTLLEGGGPYDPAMYKAQQDLRYLERGVRRWKRRAEAALDDDTARMAKAKVREWQGRIRTHVDATGVPRLRHREQIGHGRIIGRGTPR